MGFSTLLANGRFVLAQEGVGSTPSASPKKATKPSTASEAIKRSEGVYKSRFANSTVHDEKFESEDILEIVRYAEDKIYFRVHLEFYNAHLCDLIGIAVYEDGAFVFRDASGSSQEICTLAITPGVKDVMFNDIGGNCRTIACGARGGFSGAGFPLKSRRVIRYMGRLKASREYADAVAAFEKR